MEAGKDYPHGHRRILEHSHVLLYRDAQDRYVVVDLNTLVALYSHRDFNEAIHGARMKLR
jgi:hypothetical protein